MSRTRKLQLIVLVLLIAIGGVLGILIPNLLKEAPSPTIPPPTEACVYSTTTNAQCTDNGIAIKYSINVTETANMCLTLRVTNLQTNEKQDHANVCNKQTITGQFNLNQTSIPEGKLKIEFIKNSNNGESVISKSEKSYSSLTCEGTPTPTPPIITVSPTPTTTITPTLTNTPTPTHTPIPSITIPPTSTPTKTPTPTTITTTTPSPTSPPNPTATPTNSDICLDKLPAAPQLLTVKANNSTSVTLTWTQPDANVNYYVISYGTSNGNYQYGVPNTGKVTTYTINNLQAYTNYYFVIRAQKGCASSPASNELSYKPSTSIASTNTSPTPIPTLPVAGNTSTTIAVTSGIGMVILAGILLLII